jgi:hypothetical protein
MITLEQYINKNSGHYVDKYGKFSNTIQTVESYGGQCASLVIDYLVKVVGNKFKVYGNGGDFYKSKDFEIVKTAFNGCLICYPVQVGLPYGHIAIWYNGKMFSQNPLKANIINMYNGTRYYLRPLNLKPVDTNGNGIFYKTDKWLCQTTGISNLRDNFSTKAKIMGRTLDKQFMWCDGYIEVNGYRWRRCVRINNKNCLYWIAEFKLSERNVKFLTLKNKV